MTHSATEASHGSLPAFSFFQKKKMASAKNIFQPLSVHIGVFFHAYKQLVIHNGKSLFDFQTFMAKFYISDL